MTVPDPIGAFSALKYVQAGMLFNFQKPVTCRLLPMTWRFDISYFAYKLSLNYLSFKVFSTVTFIKAENNRRTQSASGYLGNLPQGPIDKAVKNFSKRLKTCVGAPGGHFEHSQW